MGVYPFMRLRTGCMHGPPIDGKQRWPAPTMSVLDPFEVAEIEMWPFWKEPSDDVLDQAEYTVYCLALKRSKFGVVLNEVEPRASGRTRTTPVQATPHPD